MSTFKENSSLKENTTFNNADNIGHIIGDVRFLHGIEKICKTFFKDLRKNDPMQREVTALNEKITEILEQVKLVNAKCDFLTSLVREKESSCYCKKTTKQIETSQAEAGSSASSNLLAGDPLANPVGQKLIHDTLDNLTDTDFPEVLQEMINDKGGVSGMKEKKNIDKINTDDFSNDIMRNYLQFKSDVAGDAILRRNGNEKKQLLREERENLTFLPPKKNTIEKNLITSSTNIPPTTSKILQEIEVAPNTFSGSIEVFPGQKHSQEELADAEASGNLNLLNENNEGSAVPIESRETSMRSFSSKKSSDSSRDKIAKVSKPIMKRKKGEKLQTLTKVKLESSRASRTSSPRKESQVQSYLDVLNALPASKRVARRKNFEPKTLLFGNQNKTQKSKLADENTSVCREDRSVSAVIHGLLNQAPSTSFQSEPPRIVQLQSQARPPPQEEYILVPVDINASAEPNIIYTDVTSIPSSINPPGQNFPCFNDYSDYMRRPNEPECQIIRLQEVQNEPFNPKTGVNIIQAENINYKMENTAQARYSFAKNAVESEFNHLIKEPGRADNSYGASSSNELETMDLYSSDALPPPENALTLDVPSLPSTTPPQKTFPDELMGIPSESNPTPLNMDFLKNLKTPSKTIDFSNSSVQKPAKKTNGVKIIPSSTIPARNSDSLPPRLIYTSSEERLGASVQAMAADFDNFELPVSHCQKTAGRTKLKSSSESLIPRSIADQSERSTVELELPSSAVKSSEETAPKKRRSRKPLIIRKVKSEELPRKEIEASSKKVVLQNAPSCSSPNEIRSIEEAAIGLLMCQSSMKSAAEKSAAFQKEKSDSKLAPSTTDSVTEVSGVETTFAGCNQPASELIETNKHEEKVIDERKTPEKACNDTESKEMSEPQSKQGSLDVSAILSPNTLDYLWNSTIINTPLLQELAESKQTPSPQESNANLSQESSSSQEARVEAVKVDLFNAKKERCVDGPASDTIHKFQDNVPQSSDVLLNDDKNDKKVAEVPANRIVGQLELSSPMVLSSACTLSDRKTSATDDVVSANLGCGETRVNIADVESKSANEEKLSSKNYVESVPTIADNKEPLESHVSPQINERKANSCDSDEESIDSCSSEVESSENETSEDNDSDSEWIDIPYSDSASSSSNSGKVKKNAKRKKTVLRRRKNASMRLKRKKRNANVLSVPTRKAMTVIKPKELKRLNESKELEIDVQICKELKKTPENSKKTNNSAAISEGSISEEKHEPNSKVGTLDFEENRETLNDAEETEIPSVIVMMTSPDNNASIPAQLEPTSSDEIIPSCQSVLFGDTTCYDSTADDEESADEKTDTESIESSQSDASQDDVFKLKEKPATQTIIKVRTISSESSPKELGKSSDLQPTLESLDFRRKELSKKNLSTLPEMNDVSDAAAESCHASKNKKHQHSSIWSSNEMEVKNRRTLKEWDRPSLHQIRDDADSFDNELRSYARKRKHSSFSNGNDKPEEDGYCLVTEVKKRRDKLEAERMNSFIPESEAQAPDLSQMESPPGYDSSAEEEALNSTIDSNATFDLGDDPDCAPENLDNDISDKEEGELSELDISKGDDDQEFRAIPEEDNLHRNLSPRQKENIDALLIEAGLDLSMDSLMDDCETLTESKNDTRPMESLETTFASEVKSCSSKERISKNTESSAKEEKISDDRKTEKIENDRQKSADRRERRRSSRDKSPRRGRSYRRESGRSRSRYSRESPRRHKSRERRDRRRESSGSRCRSYSSRDSSTRKSRGTSRRGSRERQENFPRRSPSRRTTGVHSRIDNDKNRRSKASSSSAGDSSASQNNQKTKTKEPK